MKTFRGSDHLGGEEKAILYDLGVIEGALRRRKRQSERRGAEKVRARSGFANLGGLLKRLPCSGRKQRREILWGGNIGRGQLRKLGFLRKEKGKEKAQFEGS